MKGVFKILMVLVLSQTIYGQDFKMGIVVGNNLYQKTQVERPIFIPENSYFTFIEDVEGEGIINTNSLLDAFNIGGLFSLFYKKFSFTIEPQYLYRRYNMYFYKAEPIDWTVVEKGFRLPFYFSYRVFKNVNSVKLNAGLTITRSRSIDFQSPGFGYYFADNPIYDGNNYYGRNLFDGLLYDQKNYYNYIIGITKPIKKWEYSLRYNGLLKLSDDITEHKSWQIEFSMKRYLFSYQNVTNKHFLYVE